MSMFLCPQLRKPAYLLDSSWTYKFWMYIYVSSVYFISLYKRRKKLDMYIYVSNTCVRLDIWTFANFSPKLQLVHFFVVFNLKISML